MTRFAIVSSLCLLAACDAPPPPVKAVKSPPVASFDELVRRNNCMACHQPGNQMQLPTWAQVAERYRGNKEAGLLVGDRIMQGGSGTWGNMDMPPYRADLTGAELDVLVQGILAWPVAAQQGRDASR